MGKSKLGGDAEGYPWLKPNELSALEPGIQKYNCILKQN